MQSKISTRLVLKILAGILLVLVGSYLVLHIWFNSYLRSTAFRVRVEDATSKALKSRALFDSLRFSEATVFSDHAKALGREGCGFEQIDADSVRAEFNLRGLLKRKWQIDRLTIERITMRLGPQHPGGEAISRTAPPPGKGGITSRWLPNKLEIRRVEIPEGNLLWPGGELRKSEVSIVPDGEAFIIKTANGRLVHKTFPAATLESALLRYNSPSLYIENATIRGNEAGSVIVSGEVNFERELDLHLDIRDLPINPLLTGDWRYRLFGNATGTVRVRRGMNSGNPPIISGSAALLQGRLVAMPVLDQIALFTRTQQFRSLTLSNAHAEFRFDETGTLNITNALVESAGLLRVDGRCTVRAQTVDGTFRVGVTPSALAWLPVTRDRVFTETADGYVWTTVHVTGPIDNVQEDLTPRLIAAMQEEVIQGTERTLRDATDKALDILRPLLH